MTTPPPDVIVVQAPVTEVMEVQGGETITIQGPERVEILELGIQGPEGEPGFEFEGAWSPVAYDERDIVTHDGSAWIALDVTEATDEPGVSLLWALVVSKGDTGPVGPVGPVGPTGPANELTIGTVTTLAAGAPATALISGTPPDQTLDLGIPQGIQGVQGPQGLVPLSLDFAMFGAVPSAPYIYLVLARVMIKRTGAFTEGYLTLGTGPTGGGITFLLSCDGAPARNVAFNLAAGDTLKTWSRNVAANAGEAWTIYSCGTGVTSGVANLTIGVTGPLTT